MLGGALALAPVSQLVDHPAAIAFVPDDPLGIEARLHLPWPCLWRDICV